MTNTDVEKRLLKKWKSLLTKYTNLKNNNWIRIRKRGLTTIKVDCSINKDFYLKEIEKANNIILKLTNNETNNPPQNNKKLLMK